MQRSDRLTLEPALGGATFRKPVQVVGLAGPGREWLVVESEGVVLRVRPQGGGEAPWRNSVLDIRDRVLPGSQWGLQQIALAPDFPTDPRVFVSYTARAAEPGQALESRISEFRSLDGGRTFDPSTERVLRAEGQRNVWHPIAGLRFGPDGMLYVGWGEGGIESVDERSVLRGKILRLDVRTGAREDLVPSDNPFSGGPYRPEVYAAGFRNPWRFSFDAETGALWVGDVGGRDFEEIAVVGPGEHHGWPWREGFECRDAEVCARNPGTLPRAVHSSRAMCAVIGGHVYRGRAIEWLRGKYVYGDYCSRSIHALDPADGTTELVQKLDSGPLVALDVGLDGELYVIEADGGVGDELQEERRVYRLEGREGATEPEDAGLRRLRRLGCVAAAGPTEPPGGMEPYDVLSPAWDEGARAQRYVEAGPIDVLQGDRSLARAARVFLKTLFVDDRAIETQMLARDRAGRWGAWSFEWNDAQTNALPVKEPKTRVLSNGQTWHFATAPECFRCHSEAAGRVLGFRLDQLDVDGQLERWVDSGRLRFEHGVAGFRGALGEHSPLGSPSDPTVSLDVRARSLLHTQCAPCHRPGGEGSPSPMNLTFGTPLSAMGVCGARPAMEYPEGEDVFLVAPGDPERSLVHLRAATDGSLAMPPGRQLVDRDGARLLADWIRSLDGCPD